MFAKSGQRTVENKAKPVSMATSMQGLYLFRQWKGAPYMGADRKSVV